jgi:alpha-N-arabinofuranosidase
MNESFFRKMASFLGFSLTTASLIAEPSVFFTDFSYQGLDLSDKDQQVSNSEYLNPIIRGYYPDPSICRKGEDYYLVNSTFTHFPSIPVWHSRDLVNWKQLGFAVDRPENADFNGMQTSKGMYAPAISCHDGLFYVICTNVGGYGNFYVTAKDPAGPWSDPVLLPFINGIDPSFFFDDDGSVYIVHNGDAPDGKPVYEGHRAIWMWKYDLDKKQPIGDPEILVNGGVDISKKPIWIEGPHLFKKGEFYYLICAEGGTSWEHSEVVFRTKSLTEPFVPFSKNPILTQRDQDSSRPNPVTCIGHADFVETPEGDWWSVFLGCRPYEDYYFHTGRETFLLPVTWTDGWPMVLPVGTLFPAVSNVPYLKEGYRLVSTDFYDSFDSETLAYDWTFLKTPLKSWYSLSVKPGALAVEPLKEALSSEKNSSFIGYRQKDKSFKSGVTLKLPEKEGVSAGLALYQNETANLFCGVRLEDGLYRIFVEKASQGSIENIYETSLDQVESGEISISVSGNESIHSFSYSLSGDAYTELPEIDGHFLSTHEAGGFVGVVMGPYARED